MEICVDWCYNISECARWVKVLELFRLKMPYQKELVIEVDCPELLFNFEKKYGRYIVACEQIEVPDIHITKVDGDTYTVTIGETATYTSHPVLLVDQFLFEHPSYDASVFAMHGAAVECKGKSYVFLAATTSGKTTLTSYLEHCGCGYVTDECVYIIGNAYTESFLELLNSKKIELLCNNINKRKELLKNSECVGCSAIDRCGQGCIGRAKQLGNEMGLDDQCGYRRALQFKNLFFYVNKREKKDG